MTLESVTIVGPGRMGLALGDALERSGEVSTLTYFGRRPEPPSHPLFLQGRAEYVFGVRPLAIDCSALILAVPDEVVPELAFTVAAHGAAPPGCAAFHLSGVLPTDVLGPLHGQGYLVGSLHALVTISDRLQGVDRLPGSYFAVTGSSESIAVARRLVAAIGAELFTVPGGRRPLYHAAVGLASSALLPILSLSVRLMERAGISADEAIPALLSVVRDQVSGSSALPERLPDAIAEGDVETVALHLRALDPADQRLYALLGSELVRLAGDGMDEGARTALLDLFGRYVEPETTATRY